MRDVCDRIQHEGQPAAPQRQRAAQDVEVVAPDRTVLMEVRSLNAPTGYPTLRRPVKRLKRASSNCVKSIRLQ